MPVLRQATPQSQQIGRRRFIEMSTSASLASCVAAKRPKADDDHCSERDEHQVVKVILQGGPSQVDLWDMKPNSVREIRGQFAPICTNVAGIQISECLPQIASMMDQFTIVRAISGSLGSHDLKQAETYQTATSQCLVSHAKSFQEAESLLAKGHPNIALRSGSWDHHQQLGRAIKPIAEKLDQQLSGFVQSLSNSGMLQHTTVLVWGEFGRSPCINRAGGRDHWPAVNSALIAGGPSSRGNVWGSTSDDGSHIKDHAISMEQLVHRCKQSPTIGLSPVL